jgi:hypothetical protein
MQFRTVLIFYISDVSDESGPELAQTIQGQK